MTYVSPTAHIYTALQPLYEPKQLSRYSDKQRAGRPGIDSWQGQESLPILHSVQTGSGAHPGSYPMGTGSLFPGVKRLKRETHHLPPSSAEVKNGGAITTLPHTSS
jgi:hypothetical protein